MLRDGQHQHAVHSGVAPYKPNSLDAGCPFFAGAGDDAFVDVPVTVAAAKKVRANPVSFDDHYSQAGMFWRSMSTVEKEHIMRAYTFELGKCYEQAIKERQLLALANIDPGLCAEVATGLGLPAPEADKTITDEKTRSALSQVGQKWPVDGRVVGIVVDPDGELPGVREVRQAVFDADMVPLLIAPRGGVVGDMPVQRTLATVRSVELDALLLAGSPPPAPDALVARDEKADTSGSAAVDPRVLLLVEECRRHYKAIGAWAEGVAAVGQAGATGIAGVVTSDDGSIVFSDVQDLMGTHRVRERFRRRSGSRRHGAAPTTLGGGRPALADVAATSLLR